MLNSATAARLETLSPRTGWKADTHTHTPAPPDDEPARGPNAVLPRLARPPRRPGPPLPPPVPTFCPHRGGTAAGRALRRVALGARRRHPPPPPPSSAPSPTPAPASPLPLLLELGPAVSAFDDGVGDPALLRREERRYTPRSAAKPSSRRCPAGQGAASPRRGRRPPARSPAFLLLLLPAPGTTGLREPRPGGGGGWRPRPAERCPARPPQPRRTLQSCWPWESSSKG